MTLDLSCQRQPDWTPGWSYDNLMSAKREIPMLAVAPVLYTMGLVAKVQKYVVLRIDINRHLRRFSFEILESQKFGGRWAAEIRAVEDRL